MRAWLVAAAAALVGFAAVAALFLHPYVADGVPYPLGWDAPFYVWRPEAALHDGLDRIGVVRSATPLLHATLISLTGRTAFELAAWMPAIVAAVGGLAAAGFVRAGLGFPAASVPVVAFLAWAGFGYNGMLGVHLDNLLNAALVLGAFAAATARVAAGRGLVAASLLLAAAGLAHWSFFVLAMAIYTGGVVLFARGDLWMWATRRRAFPREAGSLLAAAALPTALVGVTLLFPGPSGWTGPRLHREPVRELLERRFRLRVGETFRYYAMPLAAAAAPAALRGADRPRRLFAALLGVWVAVTVLAAVAQLGGVPTAGARLLHVFFPATILAGVFVWWLAARVATGGGAARVVLGAMLVAAAVAGFGRLAWGLTSERSRSYMEPDAVEQTEAAVAALGPAAAERGTVWLLDPRVSLSALNHRWSVIRATLPAELVPRSEPYAGLPAGYRSGAAPQGIPVAEDVDLARPVAVLIERYNAKVFAEQAAGSPGGVVAPGVMVLGPEASFGAPVAVEGRAVPTDAGAIALGALAVLAVLTLAGAGWAWTALPRDPLVRVTLAPALGLAAIPLAALAWERAGLPLSGAGALGVLAIAAGSGWIPVLLRRP